MDQSCQKCEGDCSKGLASEIEKQRDIITKKYASLREKNKLKKTNAHNTLILGDNDCTSAQKSKDPAEKKKLRARCQQLRVEYHKISI